jgi:rRNA maturation endonuclease Nob1
MIHYAYFCNDCGKSSHAPMHICERCGSEDCEHAPAYTSVDYDDAADEKRMAEIRAQVAP